MPQNADPSFNNDVRLFVYRYFVEKCRAPKVVEVADALAVEPGYIKRAFESLETQHILVLDPDSREVWMAMPFSAVLTEFKVTIGDSSWWAN